MSVRRNRNLCGASLFLAGAFLLRSQAAPDTKHLIVSDLKSGKYSAAKTLLEEALKRSPADASLWTLNGFTRLHLDKRQEALASYIRAIEISANYVPALEGASEIEFAASGTLRFWSVSSLTSTVLFAKPGDWAITV